MFVIESEWSALMDDFRPFLFAQREGAVSLKGLNISLVSSDVQVWSPLE
jgi:hypothetical protein